MFTKHSDWRSDRTDKPSQINVLAVIYKMTRIQEPIENQTPSDYIRISEKIVNRLNSIRHQLPTAIDSRDARQIFLRALQKDIASFAGWWNCLLHLREKVKPAELPAILCRGNDSLDKILYDLDAFSKSALQTSCHFNIESLFYSLLLTLDTSKGKIQGFENITKELFEKITLTSNKSSILLELKVLSGIRNSFHNNGIHNKVSYSVTIGSVNYEFIKDSPVWCASTSDTLNLLDRYCEIIEQILKTPEISSITIEISDKYADLVDPFFK